jgi:hypothetical protein
MKKVLVLAFALALASSVRAEMKETNGHWVHEYPTKSRALSFSTSSSNLSYHGGSILNAAKVVPIYWGSYWGSGNGATQRSAMNSSSSSGPTPITRRSPSTTTPSPEPLGISASRASSPRGAPAGTTRRIRLLFA